ncbi:MAG TPA: T9SS type A sorting domain-containing protein [Flavipsychrobacter sp.]
MKTLITLFTILLLLKARLFAQQGIDTAYDFCTDERIVSSIYSCLADTDFFLITGVTATKDTSEEHSFIASLQYDGSINWVKKTFFAGELNSAQSYKGIIKISPDKFLYIGSIYNFNYSVCYPYLYFFNANGDSICYKSYTDTAGIKYFSGATVHNNHIITAGTDFDTQNNIASLWIAKYDLSGNTVWQKNMFFSPAIPGNNNITLSADGKSYLVVGPMYDSVKNIFTSGMVKLDTDGHVLWMKSLPKPAHRHYNDMDIVTIPSGGYYFVSSISKSSILAPDSSYIYYGKLDENGDTVWTKTFRELFYNCKGYQLQLTPDNKHIIFLTGPYSGEKSGFMKTDTNGNVIWYSIPYYQKTSNGILHSLSISPGNKYVLCGYTLDITNPLSWVIITDSNGRRFPGDDAIQPLNINHRTKNLHNNIKIYPNPTSNNITIEGIQPATIIQLFDVTSRLVINTTAQQPTATISTHTLAAGTYILQLTLPDGEKRNSKITKR